MKHFTLLVAIIAVCFSVSLAAAQNKVVVIPLNSAKKLNNVVTVSATGGDYTDPVAAVNSITDASAANPYLVLIGPGVYTLTQTLVMKPYVTVAGSGQGATKLTGAISSSAADENSALVSGADNVVLGDLTIANTGGEYSIALYNENASPDIRDVTVTAFGGSGSFGVCNSNSSPSMINVTATASGGTQSYGVYNISSSPCMTNVTATGNASGGTLSIGVFNVNSSPSMTNVTATASGGEHNRGVNNGGDSSPIMTNVTATASGGVESNGVYNSNSSPSMTNVTATASMGTENYGVRNISSTATITTIRHCTLSGTTDGIYHDGGTTRVMQSSIIHGVTNISGTLTCVTSDNGFATDLGIDCLSL